MNVTAYSHCMGFGTGGGTGNGTGTIGSKGSWYLFLSQTCVDILHTILEPIEPCPVGGPVQCEHTIAGYELQTIKTTYLSQINSSVEYPTIIFCSSIYFENLLVY